MILPKQCHWTSSLMTYLTIVQTYHLRSYVGNASKAPYTAQHKAS